MSETSEDKTKRKYLEKLLGYSWFYQHSVFYEDTEDSVHLLKDMKAFKQLLRRTHPDQPFLIRIQRLNRDKQPQAFLNIITTKKVADIRAIADKTFSAPTNVPGQRRTPSNIESIARSISVQKPHNLEKFFNVSPIRRWSILNAAALIPAPAGMYNTVE